MRPRILSTKTKKRKKQSGVVAYELTAADAHEGPITALCFRPASETMGARYPVLVSAGQDSQVCASMFEFVRARVWVLVKGSVHVSK